jgi:uncharacterized protein (DUF3084 family)
VTALISAVTVAVASLAGLFMFRRNARKVDADTALATTEAAAAAVEMMRGLLAEQRIEIDSAKRKAESARSDAAEAKMLTQACEARERGLRFEMSELRGRLEALEANAPE